MIPLKEVLDGDAVVSATRKPEVNGHAVPTATPVEIAAPGWSYPLRPDPDNPGRVIDAAGRQVLQVLYRPAPTADERERAADLDAAFVAHRLNTWGDLLLALKFLLSRQRQDAMFRATCWPEAVAAGERALARAEGRAG